MFALSSHLTVFGRWMPQPPPGLGDSVVWLYSSAILVTGCQMNNRGGLWVIERSTQNHENINVGKSSGRFGPFEQHYPSTCSPQYCSKIQTKQNLRRHLS